MRGDESSGRGPEYLRDLAVTLSLELNITHDGETGMWLPSRHDALMFIAAESAGLLDDVIAAEVGLDTDADAAALSLLMAARPYVALWGD